MNTHDSHRLGRASVRLQEIRSWRVARLVRIEDWKFTAPDGGTSQIKLGDAWPVDDLPVKLEAKITIPQEFSGQPVELELWLGGEGFVSLSTGTTGGLNPYHRFFPVSGSAKAGETVEIRAEVVPKGLFGTHNYSPGVNVANLFVPETEVYALDRDLTMLIEASKQLEDHEVAPLLLDAIDAAFEILAPYWPTSSDVVLARYVKGRSVSRGAGNAADVHSQAWALWQIPPVPADLEPLPDEARQAVGRARAEIAARLDRIKRDYPPVGRIVMTGHAHIDLAWLWPVAETHRKARRTFSTALRLMDRYDDFTFNQSSAQAYRWIEQDDPELFERIKRRVAEGRWEPVGGSWTESDCQVTGGEAFVRQLFYGQRYFEEKFGSRCKVAWLPDVFGFSPGVPQLLRGAGLEGFFTIKINWNETNKFPYDLFEWEGIDGSRITAHMFNNPGAGYNGNVVPYDLYYTWKNFEGKRQHDETLFAFGHGDGGGGPTDQMLENYERLKDFPAMPRLRMGRVDEFFASLPAEGLPVWVGELYLELHRGTLTTQAKVKANNRSAEHRLMEAELFSTLAGLHGFPSEQGELAEAWKDLLLNQFHDVLPGSSIKEVNDDAHRMVGDAIAKATDVRDRALSYIGNLIRANVNETDNGLIVGNASLAPRPLSVLVPGLGETSTITDEKGTQLPTQPVEEGLLVHDPSRLVPAAGYTALVVSETAGSSPPAVSGVSVSSEADGHLIENDLLAVTIGSDGSISRVYDKEAGRESLAGRGNQLWAYIDKPRAWDAWDVDEDYENEGEEITFVESIKVLEEGPLRASIRVERRWRNSTITQTYRLSAGSRRLDISTHLDWHDRQVLLKALFPMNVHAHEAAFETMYGVVRRPNHRNTSWDWARFEVSGHRFADLSETGYGVAILNDGKYGHNVRGNVLGLSLLRSPMYPHPLADEGEHSFTYSLYPHPGEWTEGDVTREAFALNSPLLPAVVTPGTGHLAMSSGLVKVEGLRLMTGAVKPAEDGNGFVLRAYEPVGARGRAKLTFASEVRSAQKVNLLEDPVEGNLEVDGGIVSLDVRPFEVFTLKIAL